MKYNSFRGNVRSDLEPVKCPFYILCPIVFVLLLFLLKNNFIILEFKSVINGKEERVFIT